MTFTLLEKKAIVLAMQRMIAADNISHPNEKVVFDRVYESLNISGEEGLSFLNELITMQINMSDHYSTISNMDLEKRKDLISILTVMATIDRDLDEREKDILSEYRLFCDLPYTKYSLLEALKNANKYILR